MPDTITVRIVALSLAVLGALALCLGAWLLFVGVTAEATAVIFTAGGTAVGALASLLASTRTGVTPPAAPEPVVEAPVQVVPPT